MSSNPAINMLKAYGANIDLIGEVADIRVTPDGIRVKEFIEESAGRLLAHAGSIPGRVGDAVAVEKFYPHPTGRQVLYTHAEVIDEYTEKITKYHADRTVSETLYHDVAKRSRARR